MSHIRGRGSLVLLAAGLFVVSMAAQADVYEARQAYEEKDFARSFELYRELAELGNAEAQEALAVMYVNAEGVKRDNVLGYAWAKIALEQGPREAPQNIVDQLESHLTESARTRIAAVHAQFGKEALQKSLLPLPATPGLLPKCTLRIPVNPDDYYPREAIAAGISGNVIVGAKIWGDGRAHDPRVQYSFPERVFEAAGRAVGLKTVFAPQVENGVVVPCSILFKVMFTQRGGSTRDVVTDDVDAVRKRAESGDARSQLLYAYILEARPALAGSDVTFTGWFLRAAQAGIHEAQFKLANALLGGYRLQKDEAKARIWLEKAADGGNLDAQVALLANYSSVAKDAAWLETALEKSPDARFHVSALLASSPDAAIRNPQRALDIVKQGLQSFDQNPIAFEIRAAAQANLGDFAGAQKSQAKAVSMATGLGWDTARQRARLAGYKAYQAWTGDLFEFY